MRHSFSLREQKILLKRKKRELNGNDTISSLFLYLSQVLDLCYSVKSIAPSAVFALYFLLKQYGKRGKKRTHSQQGEGQLMPHILMDERHREAEKTRAEHGRTQITQNIPRAVAAEQKRVFCCLKRDKRSKIEVKANKRSTSICWFGVV